jgi:hypothetical protein
MKFLLFAQFLLFSFTVLLAQEPVETFDYLDVVYDSTVYRRDVPPNSLKKLEFGTDVGMAYTFSSAGYGGPMYMLSPHVTYPLSKQFSLSAGVSMVYSNFYNPYMAESGQDAMLPMTQMFIFASGDYYVNERLLVTGSVYKDILDVPNNNIGQIKSNYDSQGAAIGFQYKITPSISFGAQIRVDQPGFYNTYNPYGNGARGMYSPNWW